MNSNKWQEILFSSSNSIGIRSFESKPILNIGTKCLYMLQQPFSDHFYFKEFENLNSIWMDFSFRISSKCKLMLCCCKYSVFFTFWWSTAANKAMLECRTPYTSSFLIAVFYSLQYLTKFFHFTRISIIN